jgi:hypothetical protein
MRASRRPPSAMWFMLAAGSLTACTAPENCFAVNPATGPVTSGVVCAFPSLVEMSVSPRTASIAVGMTVQMADTITTPTTVTFAITWSSSNPTQASVDSTGVVTGKAVSTGVAICAEASKAGYGNSRACGTVFVTAPPRS